MRKKVAEAESQGRGVSLASSNLFVGTNNTSLPNQQLTDINSQIAAARGQKADLQARAQATARSGALGQADRILRHRQFGIHAPDDRAARRAALAARRAVVDAARPASAHQGIEGADRRDRPADSRRRRAAGASAGQRRQARRRPASNRSPPASIRSRSSPRRPTSRTCSCARSSARPRRSAICSSPISAKYREATARDSINAAPPEARIISRATPALEAGLSEEIADRADRGLCRLCAVGRLHRDRRVARRPPARAPAAVYAATRLRPTPRRATTYAAPWRSSRDGRRRSMPPHKPLTPTGVAAPTVDAADGTRVCASSPALAIVPCCQCRPSTDRAAACARAAKPGAASRSLGARAQCRHDLCGDHARPHAGAARPMSCWSISPSSAPNLSVISTDPNAPGIAELVAGAASFGDIITRDQYSNVHLVATGNVGGDDRALRARRCSRPSSKRWRRATTMSCSTSVPCRKFRPIRSPRGRRALCWSQPIRPTEHARMTRQLASGTRQSQRAGGPRRGGGLNRSPQRLSQPRADSCAAFS